MSGASFDGTDVESDLPAGPPALDGKSMGQMTASRHHKTPKSHASEFARKLDPAEAQGLCQTAVDP